MDRKVPIHESTFMMAFERDVDFHDYFPQATYLDLETGEMVWLFEDDEDAVLLVGIDREENREVRERVETAPQRYLEVPGRDHAEHHEILQDFLSSSWTDNEELWQHARDAYSGSIGRWKRAVNSRAVIHSYYEFRDNRVRELATQFLEEHGIEPAWR